MVRRDDDDGSLDPELSRCASPAGASPASVSIGAPSSRSPEPREIVEAEARRREPRNGRQGRGPQHEVKLAASTEKQSGSRADHFTVKATSSTRESEAVVEDSRGVESAARVHGEARNTGRSHEHANRTGRWPSESGAAEVRGDRSTDDDGDAERRWREGSLGWSRRRKPQRQGHGRNK